MLHYNIITIKKIALGVRFSFFSEIYTPSYNVPAAQKDHCVKGRIRTQVITEQR